ncbi:hypothetical protein [Saccharibacillus deserti]|uniref:hypothetical protein n=1 Tax=Saccharibacillus deserti TaxID=1634444 RepID=UPI00155221D5|nr:hypothetical protein [Saccharibacillus deserti]
MVLPKVGQVAVVGLVSPGDWTPPLLQGTSIDSNKSNEIVVGRLVSDHIGPLNIEDKTYRVMGIAGEDRGEKLINVYNFKIYMDIKDLPDSIKKEMEKRHLLRFIVRSNADPTAEIERFITAITDIEPGVQAAVVNENENYQREKNTRQGVNEVMGYPYKLFLIALINCVNISYLWIYLKGKKFH